MIAERARIIALELSEPKMASTMRPIYLAGVIFRVLLGVCDRAALMKKVTPAQDESFARRYVDLLRQQGFEQVERELDLSIADSNVVEALAKMAGMFPAGEPKSIKVVDVRFVHSRESSTDSLTFEYEFQDEWPLVEMAIQRKGSASRIVRFNVTPIADALENVNRFTLVGKSTLQYAVLLIAVSGPLFCLYVLVLCLRAKKSKSKWLWAVFILFGVGKLAVNRTTGELTLMPLSFNIPRSAVTAVPAYGPWVVAAFLPLGAILFLIKQRKSAALSEPRLSSSEAVQSPTGPSE